MPGRSVLYYFNLTDGDEMIRDENGIHLSGVNSALISAIETIAEFKQENPSYVHEWQGWRLEIADSSGWIVRSIALDAQS